MFTVWLHPVRRINKFSLLNKINFHLREIPPVLKNCFCYITSTLFDDLEQQKCQNRLLFELVFILPSHHHPHPQQNVRYHPRGMQSTTYMNDVRGRRVCSNTSPTPNSHPKEQPSNPSVTRISSAEFPDNRQQLLQKLPSHESLILQRRKKNNVCSESYQHVLLMCFDNCLSE